MVNQNEKVLDLDETRYLVAFEVTDLKIGKFKIADQNA